MREMSEAGAAFEYGSKEILQLRLSIIKKAEHFLCYIMSLRSPP